MLTLDIFSLYIDIEIYIYSNSNQTKYNKIAYVIIYSSVVKITDTKKMLEDIFIQR